MVKKRIVKDTAKTRAAKSAAAKAASTARTRALENFESFENSKPISGFLDFIRERGVVGLAVGLAIGTAATGLVNQMVNAVIVPFVNMLIGNQGLKGWKVNVDLGRGHEAEFLFGELTDAMIKFIAIAAVVYFVVKGLKLDRLDKKKED